MSHTFCPHCGYDLRRDTAIMIDDFFMVSSIAPLTWRGKAVKLTGSERMLCYTLMKAYPSPVRHEALLDRLDSESTSNALNVFVSRIRRKLREIGAPDPIKSLSNRGRGRSMMWNVGGEHEVGKKAA